jgi:putative bacteriocin precursor
MRKLGKKQNPSVATTIEAFNYWTGCAAGCGCSCSTNPSVISNDQYWAVDFDNKDADYWEDIDSRDYWSGTSYCWC